MKLTLPKELTTVTKTSKILAAIVFITLPFIGFFLGANYERSLNLASQQSTNEPILSKRLPTPTPSINICATNKKTYRSLEEAVKEPEKVCYLDLSKKGLTKLPQQVLELTNLNTLYLNFNNLASLFIEIANLKNLELIDLTGNPRNQNLDNDANKIKQLNPRIKILYLQPMNLP